MNSKWISSFLTVADCGSVNKAAKMLYISQQALNQQINLLESEVGVALFERKPIGVSLTLAGNEFLKYAQQMESLYATALSRCRLASKAEKRSASLSQTMLLHLNLWNAHVQSLISSLIS